jgi:hypothetical protein
MDRAYEGNETRYLAQSLGFEPVVPPLQTRRDPWSYDTELSERRNEIERLFGRIKRFRRVFTRYDKTDPGVVGRTHRAPRHRAPHHARPAVVLTGHTSWGVDKMYALLDSARPRTSPYLPPGPARRRMSETRPQRTHFGFPAPEQLHEKSYGATHESTPAGPPPQHQPRRQLQQSDRQEDHRPAPDWRTVWKR